MLSIGMDCKLYGRNYNTYINYGTYFVVNHKYVNAVVIKDDNSSIAWLNRSGCNASVLLLREE
jgi:hypothetical protein